MRPDRFAPRGTLSRKDLMAYAEGRLDPAAAHSVERHLEADPLLHEAAEGLRQPGALSGLQRLHAHAPRAGGHPWLGWTLSVAVVLLVAGTVSLFVADVPSAPPTRLVAEAAVPVTPDPTPNNTPPALTTAEIGAAMEIPESLHIGHATTDRHSIVQVHTLRSAEFEPVERIALDPMNRKGTSIVPNMESEAMSTPRVRKASMQLIYLHDLKLLHPKEMYGRSPEIEPLSSGVDARFVDAPAQRAAQGEEHRIAYLAYMDDALEKFIHEDHKGCLEELLFVLVQYPEDVNALFYAGLCCYNLGLDQRAERYLRMAAEHRFRVFDEEADWYHALAMERTGQYDSAHIAFDRIARSTSFYAERARVKSGR